MRSYVACVTPLECSSSCETLDIAKSLLSHLYNGKWTSIKRLLFVLNKTEDVKYIESDRHLLAFFLFYFLLFLHVFFSSFLLYSILSSLFSFFLLSLSLSLLCCVLVCSRKKICLVLCAVSQFIWFIQLQISQRQGPCVGHCSILLMCMQSRCSVSAWGTIPCFLAFSSLFLLLET